MTRINVGFGVALSIGGLLLVASLWNPAACLPLALMFLFVALGIRHRLAWRAFGGALLIAAIAATGTVTLLRNHAVEVPLGSLSAGWLFLLVPAWLLYQMGRA